jgi:divalent metal cation (Fe/Co/Zn/Cd) transporter
MLLFVSLLALLFFVSFFVFGGWVILDRLPAWVGRLSIFLVGVLIAWNLLTRVIDRIERGEKRPPL